MINLIPLSNEKQKDLYLQIMKLINEEIDPRQFLKDNYYHSMVEAIYRHCFEALESRQDLVSGGVYSATRYALEEYVEAAVDIFYKIDDLNKYFELAIIPKDEKLIVYIAGQFLNYFRVNQIDFGEDQWSFAEKMKSRIKYSQASSFRRKSGEHYGVEKVGGSGSLLSDLIYDSKKKMEDLAKATGWTIEDIKLLRAGRVEITKDIYHMMFFALELARSEALIFLKKSGDSGGLGLEDFKEERDQKLLEALNTMTWYSGQMEYRGKNSVEIANALLEEKGYAPLKTDAVRLEKKEEITTVLLTGGLGFIGRNCIDYFERLNRENPEGKRYRVCVLARRYFEKLPENVICYRGNIDSELMYEHVLAESEVDYVVHLAAISTVKQGAQGLVETFEINAQSANYIYNTVRRNQFPVKCIILPSTTRVYRGMFGNDPVCTEQAGIDLKKIVNDYDCSKFIAEKEAEQFARSAKIPVIITRLSNVYGEGDRNVRLIPETIRRLDAGEAPTLFVDQKSGKTELLNFLYVGDLAGAFVRIMEKVGSGEYQYDPSDIIYNIGSPQDCYVSDAVKLLSEIMGKDYKPVCAEGSYSADRRLDVSKAEEVFGIRAATGLREGLERTVRWYLETKEEKEE